MPATSPPLTPAIDAPVHHLVEPSVRLAIYEASPVSAQADPPAPAAALLIHSVNAAASAAEVRPLFEALRQERAVAAPDLPGFGLSPRDARRYTPRLMTDAVLAAARRTSARAGHRPLHAFAVSLGTEFLARAAVEAPELFASLTLISPTGLRGGQVLRGAEGSTRFMALADQIIRGPGWGRWLFRQLTRPGVVRYFLRRTWGGREIDDALWAYAVRSARVPGAEHAPLDFLSGGLFSADIHRVYEAVRAPVLVIHGTRGDFTDYRALPLQGCHPPWQVEVMHGCGALPHFERLPPILQAWRRFVAERPTAPTPRPAQGDASATDAVANPGAGPHR